MNRMRLTVKVLESQLEAERREKNSWKSKYEELEEASKGNEV